jgi:hypothetical protein
MSDFGTSAPEAMRAWRPAKSRILSETDIDNGAPISSVASCMRMTRARPIIVPPLLGSLTEPVMAPVLDGVDSARQGPANARPASKNRVAVGQDRGVKREAYGQVANPSEARSKTP